MTPLQSKKAGVLRAKMIFGALTIFDLHEVVKSRGGYSCYSIGSHWLPISFVRRHKGFLSVWSSGEPGRWNEADLRIPGGSVVKVVGNSVSLNLDRINVENGYNIGSGVVELRIALEFVPFPEG